mmetsp:Transcript_54586/g.130224  ORF Transcript_54586/g.130224 Transcript_54586/m.130224 type:complete len:930 (+) Transcript_54586:138-2927(+)
MPLSLLDAMHCRCVTVCALAATLLRPVAAQDVEAKCDLKLDQVIGQGQLSTVNASSALECCQKCFDLAGCISFTHSAYDNTCELKDNVYGVEAKDGFISGTHQSRTKATRACALPGHTDYPFCNTNLSVDQRVDDLVSRLRLEEKPLLLTARASPMGAVPRLGIPEYDWGANCIHGVQSRCRERCPTTFPNPNAQGAAWNRSLWQDMAAVTGKELRALWLADVGEFHTAKNTPHLGLDCWSPNININRDPRWGRNLETPGEDPYLNGEYGKVHTVGLQYGEDRRYLQAVVTLKHFAAYSLEDSGGGKGMPTRHSFDAVVSKADLAGTYFKAFKTSVREGGAKGVMCSYNSINGVPSCANSLLLKDALRDAWNFSGYVTSDTGAVRDVYAEHWTNLTAVEGAAAAVKAGCDIDSSGSGDEYGPYKDKLTVAVHTGLLEQADVDQLLRRTLRMRFELGLFDPIHDQPYWTYSVTDNVATQESEALSRFATKQGIVLLKNELVNGVKALPLQQAQGTTVAVLGPHALAQQSLVGNYLGQICPDKLDSFDCVETPATAVQQRTRNTIVVEPGCDLFGSSTKGIPAAVEAATAHDVSAVILFVGLATQGNDEYAEREGHDRTTLELPGVQMQLIQKVVEAVNNVKPVVVVLINGGALGVDWLKEAGNSHAVIEAFYPGRYGADAIVGAIFGEYSPGGKLPYSVMPANYVKEVDFLNMSMNAGTGRTYRFYEGTPLWPFGWGLSYTKFQLTFAKAAADSTSGLRTAFIDGMEVRITVKNVGQMEGDEVVQAYFVPEDVSVVAPAPLPKRQLFDFERVHLEPGQSRTLTFKVPATALALADAHGNLVSAPGRYRLLFTNGVDASIQKSIQLHGKEEVLERFPGSRRGRSINDNASATDDRLFQSDSLSRWFVGYCILLATLLSPFCCAAACGIPCC